MLMTPHNEEEEEEEEEDPQPEEEEAESDEDDKEKEVGEEQVEEDEQGGGGRNGTSGASGNCNNPDSDTHTDRSVNVMGESEETGTRRDATPTSAERVAPLNLLRLDRRESQRGRHIQFC
ncbi:hypothetical protein FNV43_RR17838 [Rhamnella rubrinervis]|uniref:Uncharacterized protein n=1 Tax=Rhamnella rubrinervis TaxID=2594499 RepID=A0A8K0E521_9ROSA|nr:hypothetical protein FNV43_RR17838 [Rhamnella rubrinervis]